MSRLAVPAFLACAYLGTALLGRPVMARAADDADRGPRWLTEMSAAGPLEPEEATALRPHLEEFKAGLLALEPAIAHISAGVYTAADHETLSRGLETLRLKADAINALAEARKLKTSERDFIKFQNGGVLGRVDAVPAAIEAEAELWRRISSGDVVRAASTKRLLDALQSVQFQFERTLPHPFLAGRHAMDPVVRDGLENMIASLEKGLKAENAGVLSTRLAAAFDGGGGGADGTGAVAAGASGAPRRDAPVLSRPQAARSLTQALDGKELEVPAAAAGGKASLWSRWGLDDLGQSARRAWTEVLPDSLSGAAAPAYAELARRQREQTLERSVQTGCAWLEREGGRADAALLDECRGASSLPSEKKLTGLLSLRLRLEAALDAGVTARVEARAMAGEASAEELEALKTEQPYFEARAALAREVTGNRAIFAAFADGTVFSAAELGLAPGKAPSGSVVKSTWRGLPGFKTAAGGFESLDGSVSVETTTAGGKTRELVHAYDGEKIRIAVHEDGKELGATIFAPDRKRPGLFASHDAASRWPETVGRFAGDEFQPLEIVNEDGSGSRPLDADNPDIWVNRDRGGTMNSWTFDTRAIQGLDAAKRRARITAVCGKFMGKSGRPALDAERQKKAQLLAAVIFDFADAGEPVTLDGYAKSVSVQEPGRRVVGAWSDGEKAKNKRPGLTAYSVHEGRDPRIIAHYLGWNDRDVFRESTEDNFDSVLEVVAFGYQIRNLDWIYHQNRDAGLKWKTAVKEKVGEQLIFDGPGILGHIGNTVGTAAKGVVDVAAGVIAAAQIVNPGYYATVKAVGGEIDYAEMPKRAWSNFAGNAIVRGWFDQDQLAKIGVDDKIALRNVRAEMTSLGQPLTGAVLSAGVSFADNTVMMIPTVAAFNALGHAGKVAGLANSTKLLQGGAAVYFTYQGGADLVSSTRGFLDARRSFDPADPASKARYYDSVENLLVSGGNMAIIVGGLAEAKFAKAAAPAVEVPAGRGPLSSKLSALDAKIPGGLAKLPGGTALNRVLGMTPGGANDEAIQAWLREKRVVEPASGGVVPLSEYKAKIAASESSVLQLGKDIDLISAQLRGPKTPSQVKSALQAARAAKLDAQKAAKREAAQAKEAYAEIISPEAQARAVEIKKLFGDLQDIRARLSVERDPAVRAQLEGRLSDAQASIAQAQAKSGEGRRGDVNPNRMARQYKAAFDEIAEKGWLNFRDPLLLAEHVGKHRPELGIDMRLPPREAALFYVADANRIVSGAGPRYLRLATQEGKFIKVDLAGGRAVVYDNANLYSYMLAKDGSVGGTARYLREIAGGRGGKDTFSPGTKAELSKAIEALERGDGVRGFAAGETSFAAEAAPTASRTQRSLWESKLRNPRDQMSFDDILNEVRRVGPENVRGVPHWGSSARQAGPDCAIQALYGQLKPFYLGTAGGSKRGYYDFFNLLRWTVESPQAGVTDGLRMNQLVKFYEAVLGPEAVRNGEVRAMRVTHPSQFEALGNDVHIGILSLNQGQAHAVVVDGAIKTPQGWDVYVRDSNLGGRVKIVYTAQELISLDLKLISVRLNPEAVLANLESMQKSYAMWKAVQGGRGGDFPLIGSDAELRAASGGRGAVR